MNIFFEKPVRDQLTAYEEVDGSFRISQQGDNGGDPHTIILHIDDAIDVSKELNKWLRARRKADK